MNYKDGIKVYDPNRTSKNIMFSKIMHNSSEISIQVPKNRLILDKEKNKCKLTLSDEILEVIKGIDDSIIELTSENSEKWFNKKLNLTESKSIYKNNIKENILSCFFDENTIFYKSKKESVAIEEISEEIEGIALLKCDVIVFSKTYFYTRWVINQFKIKENVNVSVNVIEEDIIVLEEYSIKDLPEHEIDDNYVKKLEEITLF
jgi:hypothetical protein